jgi:hypothetical protein
VARDVGAAASADSGAGGTTADVDSWLHVHARRARAKNAGTPRITRVRGAASGTSADVDSSDADAAVQVAPHRHTSTLAGTRRPHDEHVHEEVAATVRRPEGASVISAG